ncbi:hypothetical protein FJZ18_03635 [Candidatus Pacearchaeota archaeon]|nr:hypothetical protein [Candidatus Pacearchaeota archaeon]
MNEAPPRPPVNYVIEVSRSHYDLIRDKEDSFPYPTTSHLPAFPKTFKDLPGNISNRLEGVTVGDSIIFHCETSTGEYSTDIERVVVRIETDRKNFMNILHFSKNKAPAWKRK